MPKSKFPQILQKIHALKIQPPAGFHQVLIANVAGCGADVISTAEMP
ncbi:MAG: DUF1667 domain-containing protein [Defluviitaleaceae bacterium]|nr:DUF1667 domain-containing protein [Defluviitaleaceae bacterium]